jgi:helix-turn-helix protein
MKKNDPRQKRSRRAPKSSKVATTITLERLLTTQEVADRLRCSVSCLNKLRVSGTGPPFIYVQRRVRYHPSDVAAYIEAQRRISTSADAPPAEAVR